MTIRAILNEIDREKLQHAAAIRRIDRATGHPRILEDERQSRVAAIRRLDLWRERLLTAARDAKGRKCDETKRMAA